MLFSKHACCLACLLLLNGLSVAAQSNESVSQQAPLELPKTLNDLDLSPPVDMVKSVPVKKTVKSDKLEKREVKNVNLVPAKSAAAPLKDLGGLPEFTTYTTKAGDTVDKVLQKFYGNTPLRTEVLREALVQNNPKAFAKGNPKKMMAGVSLALPDPVELAKKLSLATLAAASGDTVTVTPVSQSNTVVTQVSTPAVPAGGGGAVAHSAGHNLPVQDVKRNWVRYP